MSDRLEATQEHWKAEAKLKRLSGETMRRLLLRLLRRGRIPPRSILSARNTKGTP